MTCPNCHEADLEVYDYEDALSSKELQQHQQLWCPNCRYHCEHIVRFKEIDRQVAWEEK